MQKSTGLIDNIDIKLNQNPRLDMDTEIMLVKERNLAVYKYNAALDQINGSPEDKKINSQFMEKKYKSIAEGSPEPKTFRGKFKVSFTNIAYMAAAVVVGLVSLII